MKYRWICKI